MTEAPPHPSASAQDPALHINQIATETLLVPIVGLMPLIVSKFSDKAKRQMLDAQQGKRTPKEPRDPKREYEASLYRTKDGYGFPVTGFKAATVGAARFYGKDVKMTELRQFLFMFGEMSDNDPQALVPIIGEPRMREDTVRLAGQARGADLRYRAEFPEWSATLVVKYVTSSLSRDSVLSLIDAGGFGIGVGEWRPERKGDFGTYTIDRTRELEIMPGGGR